MERAALGFAVKVTVGSWDDNSNSVATGAATINNIDDDTASYIV